MILSEILHAVSLHCGDQVSVFGGFLRLCAILVVDFLIQPLVGKADAPLDRGSQCGER